MDTAIGMRYRHEIIDIDKLGSEETIAISIDIPTL